MGKVEKSPYDLLQESLNTAIGLIEKNSGEIEENNRGIKRIHEKIGFKEEEKKEDGEASQNNTVSSQLDVIHKQLELLKAERLKTEIEKMCFYFKKGSNSEFETLALGEDETDNKIKRIADCLGELNQVALRIGDKVYYQLVIEGHTNKHFKRFCCCRRNPEDRSEYRAETVSRRILDKLRLPRESKVSIQATGRSYFYRINNNNSPLNARVTFVVNTFFSFAVKPLEEQGRMPNKGDNPEDGLLRHQPPRHFEKGRRQNNNNSWCCFL